MDRSAVDLLIRIEARLAGIEVRLEDWNKRVIVVEEGLVKVKERVAYFAGFAFVLIVALGWLFKG